jgi:hypothetical protein
VVIEGAMLGQVRELVVVEVIQKIRRGLDDQRIAKRAECFRVDMICLESLSHVFHFSPSIFQ